MPKAVYSVVVFATNPQLSTAGFDPESRLPQPYCQTWNFGKSRSLKLKRLGRQTRAPCKVGTVLHLLVNAVLCVCLQENTEYRYEYQRKNIPPCIAGVLKGGARCGGQPVECYDYVETDPAGHDWYRQAHADRVPAVS